MSLLKWGEWIHHSSKLDKIQSNDFFDPTQSSQNNNKCYKKYYLTIWEKVWMCGPYQNNNFYTFLMQEAFVYHRIYPEISDP